MPRNGSGVFSAPAGTTATPNTTIESSKYNAFVADIVADMNAARPVTAGGTGVATLTGLAKGNGTSAFTAAVAGTDYVAPGADTSLTSVYLNNTGLKIKDTNASHGLVIAPGSDLTADRTLTLTTGDAARTVTLSGNPTLADWFDQSVKTTASPTFGGLTLTAATSDIVLNTSDAADNKALRLAGGGAYAVGRGANIALYGNEAAGTPGELHLVPGGTGAVVLYNSVASEIVRSGTAGLIFSAATTDLRMNTTDGADDKVLRLAGGGAYAVDRGANVGLFGNEAAGTPGELQLVPGSAGAIVLYNSSGTETARTTGTGFNIGVATAFSMTSGSEVGAYIQRDGNFAARAAGQAVMLLGRLTSDGTIANFYRQNTNVGSISVSAAATAFNTSSDERLKNFIGKYDPAEAIRIIRADPVREFNWIEEYGGGHAIGWGAQTSFKVSPDLATPGTGRRGSKDFQPWGVDQGKRTPYLWAAVTNILDRLEALENA